MKIVVQRCSKASVEVNNKIVGQIATGLTILVGFTHTDTYEDIERLAKKVSNLRIFADDLGVMNKSVQDINGSVLSISQFTLYADSSKGHRPSYVNALKREKAEVLYALFNQKLREQNLKVETGIFGADMKVNLVNDGPVTIILES